MQKKFTDIVQDKTGGNYKIKKEDYLDSGKFPVIDQGQQFIGGYTNDEGLLCKIKLPCIIFGDHTKVFKYIDFPFAMGADGVKVLKCNDEIDTKYIYYFLKQYKLGGKEGYNRNFKYLKDIQIPLPPLTTQRAIAERLDQIQELIDLKKQALAKTDELAKSIFLEMFGEPMTNEKGWEVKKFSDVCSKITDGTHHSPKMQTSGYPYISAKHIKKHGIDISKLEYVSEADHRAIYNRCDPKKGDVLYIKDGATTGIAQVNNFDFEFSMLSSLALLRPSKDILNAHYLVYYLNDENTFRKLILQMGGAAIKRFTLQKINNFTIPLPPLLLQQQFAEIITEIEAQKTEHKQALTKLEELYQAEMQRSFSL